uniref:Ubiquitin-like domain-containing protein n=1 Tax=Eptatretus burgeri TaxID=7764 RepID=A0A8C4QPB1_EPTBU
MQRPRAVKGVHSSQNAYMLVYNRCRTPLPPHPLLPDWLMQLVKQDSSKFEEFSDQLATLRKKDMDAGIAKHEEVKLLYQILPVLNVGDRSEEDGTEEDEKAEELSASAAVKRFKFNEDIICKHGQMTNEMGKRELVSSEIWNILRAYFPSCPEYAHDIQPCQQCQDQAEEVKQLVASEQSTTLLSSLQNCNRPDLDCWPSDTNMLYVVTCSFLDEWRKFVSHPERERHVLSVENKSLLCEHQKLIVGLDSIPPNKTAKLALVLPQQWKVLSSLFDVDCTISISRNKSNEEICYTMQPEECEECCRRGESFIHKQRKVLDYTQAMVYVRKIEGTQKVMEIVPELHQSSSECEEDKDDKPEEKDPDFRSANGVKRKRPVGQSENPSTIRRSSRHRRLRGDKSFLVSSSQSLKEFKIQIMNVFSVAPFDQNLFMEDRSLTDDSALLGSLGVVPGSIILLQADETVMDEEQVELCIPEEGFKGTGLLGN